MSLCRQITCDFTRETSFAASSLFEFQFHAHGKTKVQLQVQRCNVFGGGRLCLTNGSPLVRIFLQARKSCENVFLGSQNIQVTKFGLTRKFRVPLCSVTVNLWGILNFFIKDKDHCVGKKKWKETGNSYINLVA